MKQLKTTAKTFEEEFARKNGEYEREKLHRPDAKVVDQFKWALRYNLVGEALRILNDKASDLPKEYPGPALLEILLIRIALEMTVGRLEDSAATLEVAPEILKRTPMPPNILKFREVQLQSLTYQKLLFEGNFKAAGEILESEMTGQFDADPPLTPVEAAMKPQLFIALKSPDVPGQIAQLSPANPLLGFTRDVLILNLSETVRQRQQKLNTIRGTASDFFYLRGFLSLLEGDIATARTRFEQSRRSDVPEWGVPARRNANAERYLRLIEEAEKKARSKSPEIKVAGEK